MATRSICEYNSSITGDEPYKSPYDFKPGTSPALRFFCVGVSPEAMAGGSSSVDAMYLVSCKCWSGARVRAANGVRAKTYRVRVRAAPLRTNHSAKAACIGLLHGVSRMAFAMPIPGCQPRVEPVPVSDACDAPDFLGPCPFRQRRLRRRAAISITLFNHSQRRRGNRHRFNGPICLIVTRLSGNVRKPSPGLRESYMATA